MSASWIEFSSLAAETRGRTIIIGGTSLCATRLLIELRLQATSRSGPIALFLNICLSSCLRSAGCGLPACAAFYDGLLNALHYLATVPEFRLVGS
jgi:hypothetical protein